METAGSCVPGRGAHSVNVARSVCCSSHGERPTTPGTWRMAWRPNRRGIPPRCHGESGGMVSSERSQVDLAACASHRVLEIRSTAKTRGWFRDEVSAVTSELAAPSGRAERAGVERGCRSASSRARAARRRRGANCKLAILDETTQRKTVDARRVDRWHSAARRISRRSDSDAQATLDVEGEVISALFSLAAERSIVIDV